MPVPKMGPIEFRCVQERTEGSRVRYSCGRGAEVGVAAGRCRELQTSPIECRWAVDS